MRIAAGWTIAALVLAQASAQEPPESPPPTAAALRRDLTSGDSATIAWAAYRAGQHEVQAVIPELRAALRQLAGPADDGSDPQERRCTLRAVFDGLVRTGAELPPDELAPWMQAGWAQAFVLGSRNPERHAGLLIRVVEKQRADYRWLAACNLLLATSPEVVVPELTRRTAVDLRITVFDAPGFEGMRGSFGMSHGSGRGQRPKGYPPAVYYDLRLSGRRSQRMAPGLKPVYYARYERTSETHGLGGHEESIDAPDYALRCLLTLADRDAEHDPLRSAVNKTVVWTTSADLLVATERMTDDLQAEWTDLLRALCERDLCSPETAERGRLRIRVTFDDARDPDDQKRSPLPPAPGTVSGGG